MYYVISDIHGDYESFYKMLLQINFSSDDYLYILGDIVDKGQDNLRLLQYVRSSENAILLKGNHEYFLERYLKGLISSGLWDACGGNWTRKEVDKLSNEGKKKLLKYVETLPIYENVTINGEDFFLTHSGYHADYSIINADTGWVDIQESVNLSLKKDYRGYLFSNDIHHIPANLRFDKKIVVGHYPTIFIPGHEKAKIYFGRNYIDIDTGNERREESGRLSCLRLDDGKEFYI